MLKRNLIANYAGQAWMAIMGIAFVPLYIKHLGMEAYGVIGIFAVLQAWMALLDAGMTPALNREMARFLGGQHTPETIRDVLRTVEFVALGIALALALALAASANWLAVSWTRAETLSSTELAGAFVAMGLVLAFRLVEGVYRASLLGMMFHVRYNAVASAMATIRALGAVAALLWISPTISTFFLWQAIASLAAAVAMMALAYGSLPAATRAARFSLDQVKNIWRFAAGVAGISFLALLLTQVDKVLLSRLLTLSAYGSYALATLVASLAFTLVAPVAQTWFPRMSQLHAAKDTVRLAHSFHDGAQLVAVVLGSFSAVLIVFAEPLLLLWTGNPQVAAEAAPLVRLLVAGNMLNGLMWIPCQAQLACGLTTLALRVNLASVLLLVPAIFWVTPRYGAEGAAWVWMLLNVGYLLVMGQLMYGKILVGEKLRWYLDDVLAPVGAAAFTSAAVYVLVPGAQGPIGQVATIAGAMIMSIGAATACSTRLRIHARKLLPRIAGA